MTATIHRIMSHATRRWVRLLLLCGGAGVLCAVLSALIAAMYSRSWIDVSLRDPSAMLDPRVRWKPLDIPVRFQRRWLTAEWLGEALEQKMRERACDERFPAAGPTPAAPTNKDGR